MFGIPVFIAKMEDGEITTRKVEIDSQGRLSTVKTKQDNEKASDKKNS